MKLLKKSVSVLIASIMIFSSFVVVNINSKIKVDAATILKGDIDNNGKLNAVDLVYFIGFILNSPIPNTYTTTSLDFNDDNNIDIIDLIIMKQTILYSQNEEPTDIKVKEHSSTYGKSAITTANSNAKTIYNAAQIILFDYEMNDEYITGTFVFDGSNTNDSLIQEINNSITITANSKYCISIKNNQITSVVYCGTNDLYSGAYPNTIPSNLSCTFNSALLPYASDENFDWNTLK